ncbi:MAG: phospholipase D family protein [Burkholderiaceae bacterium]|nr:phospholipase D family protein [Burkholderiaceae bacterium]
MCAAITPAPLHPGPAMRWIVILLAALWLAGCASLPDHVERPVSSALSAPSQTRLGQLIQSRQTSAGARSDSGFALLSSVEMAYGGRLALIEAAQKTLDLQYYAIHADSSTERLLQRLRAAARRGVRVRILLDDFNTVGRDVQVLRLAYEPNIEMRLFNPLPGGRRSSIGRILGSLDEISRIQQRMHNKLFIADNVVGITGGRNLGDAYFGQDKGSNFIDMDVLAVGRIVTDMSASFDRFWNNDLAYPVQSLITQQELDQLSKPATDSSTPALSEAQAPIVAAAPSVPATPITSLPSTTTVLPDGTPTIALANTAIDLQSVTLTWAPAMLMVDKPGKIGPDEDEVDAGDTLIDGLLGLMSKAKSGIDIISPYFVPGRQMMKVFADLKAKGVRVRVLTNSLASNDAPAAHAGYARYRQELLSEGIELYEMRSESSGELNALGSTGGSSGSASGGSIGNSRASLHAKAVVVDSQLIVIGSMNLDLRSQIQNTEVALVIRSASMSKEAIRQIESTLRTDAYRVEQSPGGTLVWRAPAGAGFADTRHEPDASLKLRLLIQLISPFAPDEML